MNKYCALEVKDETTGTGAGYYHFTMTNDGITTPVGYCRENKNHSDKCHHKTKIETADCYRKYCLEKQNGMMAGFPMDKEYGTPLYISSSY